jgi:hypothetical protein
LTNWEDPGGDPLSIVTLARATDATVQRLGAARARELTRGQELAAQLAQDEAQAKKLARSHKQAKERSAAKASTLARQILSSKPVTPAQIRAFGRKELARESELARELERIEARVAAVSQALAQSQLELPRFRRRGCYAAGAGEVCWRS